MLLERGDNFGETDIILNVDERFPLRLYGGMEDSGTLLTGENRWLTGFNWGNAFGLDHQMSYQFTSAFNADELNAHSFSYIAPLSWRHTASLFGAYVESDPGEDPAGLDLGGESWQLGGSYNLPLKQFNDIKHEATLGYVFKRSNNNLRFGGLDVFNTFTDISQFLVGYGASLTDRWGATSLRAGMNISPGGMTSKNDDESFNASRASATADYVYGRINLGRVTRLPKDFTWLIDAQLQVSSNNLLGSEQLGLGGYLTIRGYDEYQIVGDEGIIVRTELRTPSLSLLRHFDIDDLRDELQLLAFFDYGIVGVVDPLPGEHSTELASAGVGFRYAINPYFTVRFDYGWQLEEATQNNDRDSQTHIGVIIGY